MRVIAITGLECFAERMVKDLQSYAGELEIVFVKPKLEPGTVYNLIRADIVHFIGGNVFVSNSKWKSFLFQVLSFRKKIVLHWVGSDILRLESERYNEISNIYHACEVDWTARELKSKGIKVEILPIIGLKIPSKEAIKLPEEFSVLTYMGKDREYFYGLWEIMALAKNLSYIKVKVMGTLCNKCQISSLPKNLEFIGWIDDVQSLINSSSVYIRHVKHDGLSISVLEALSACRYVCYNYPLEGCYYTPTVEELINRVGQLHSMFLKGVLKPNFSGFEQVRRKYSRKIVYGNLIKFYRELLK
jgi:glycosyltransferase involved in cell wall biosynthesis